MLFRLRTHVWLEVDDLPDAEAAITPVAVSAVAELGDAAVQDPVTRAWATSDLVAADDAAHAALRAADLGPGICSALHTADLHDPGKGEEADAAFERDLRATNIGEGLAHALMRHLRDAAKNAPELDADSALHAASDYLQDHAEEVDWAAWAAHHDVRDANDQRQN